MENKYQVIDGQTKQVMGTYSSRKRADRRADRLNNEYGAHRYSVKTIWAAIWAE
jgi:hypothetical protein